jgi:hypothetical protein
MRILGRLLARRERLLVAREAIAEQRGRPLRQRESIPLAAGNGVARASVDQSCCLVLMTAEGSQ